jgi:diadenosine tetraphosphate (Ap4A) HIT family hydrolase
VASSPDVPFRRLFSPEEVDSEFLLETDNFVVVADVAPVVEGHCLVVSRRHCGSMARMGAAGLAELVQLVDVVEGVLGEPYGPCCAFEHGSGDRRDTASCIEHAHMHIAPYSGDLRGWSQYRDSFVSVPGLHSLNSVEGNLPYLFTRSADRNVWLSMRQRVERQHWRRVLAVAAGVDLYDWRWMASVRRGRILARDRIANVREQFRRRVLDQDSR